jgi:hypothetical protein
VDVFGESPVAGRDGKVQLLAIFRPSRGINPGFGARTSEYEDGAHYLYMLQMEGDAGSLLGRPAATLGKKIIVKVGYSRDPTRRRDEHYAALPPAGQFRWNLKLTSKAFVDGQAAKNAEDGMKDLFAHRFESLGGEFFAGNEVDLVSAFASAAAPAAFRITATRRV